MDDEIEIKIDDQEVLDYSNCFHPLRPPLYQGNTGHVTCPSCCENLSNKCHICTGLIENTRNVAVENVLEASRISCTNKLLGCFARIPYYQKDAHMSTCPLVLCVCPEISCNCSSSSVRLLEHWRDEHNWAFRTFNYGTTFHITLSYTPSYRVLVDDKSDKMFVLSVSRVSHGVALSVVCVGPSSLPDSRGPKYSYKLTVKRDEHGSGAGSSCSRSRGRGVEFSAPVMSSTLQKRAW